MSVLTADKIVPISRFNKGEAAKIFAEVKSKGTKYVFKNNMPECVLISPEDYQKIMERLENMELYVKAMERHNRPDRKIYSESEAVAMLGLEKPNPDDSEVEIE